MPTTTDPKQPKPAQSPPAGSSKAIGRSGTNIFSGWITGEEYNTKLVGLQGIKIYDTMRRSDATVRAMLRICKLPIKSTTWEFTPPKDDPKGQYKADFLKRELMDRNVNWPQLLSDILTMLDFGFSLFELVFEVTEFDGEVRIGIKAIESRKQSTVERWETRDGKPGVTQTVVGDTFDIPLVRLLRFTHDQEGDNYAGISLLRYAFKHWDIKDKLDLVNAVALERQGVGIPQIEKGIDGEEPSEPELEKARQSVRQMRANEEAFVESPKGVKVSWMDMKGHTTKEILPTISYHDRQIMKSVLAQFVELGGNESGSGSRATSQDHSSLFMKSEIAVANIIVGAIQEQLVKKLCDLNFSDNSYGYPVLEFGSLDDDDPDNLAKALKDLADAGLITADDGIEAHLRNLFGLPEMPDELKGKDRTKKPQPSDKKVVEDVADDNDLEDEDEDAEKSLKTALESAEKTKRMIDVLYVEG